MKNLIERIMRATTWQCQNCGYTTSVSNPPTRSCPATKFKCVWKKQ